MLFLLENVWPPLTKRSAIRHCYGVHLEYRDHYHYRLGALIITAIVLDIHSTMVVD